MLAYFHVCQTWYRLSTHLPDCLDASVAKRQQLNYNLWHALRRAEQKPDRLNPLCQHTHSAAASQVPALHSGNGQGHRRRRPQAPLYLPLVLTQQQLGTMDAAVQPQLFHQKLKACDVKEVAPGLEG